MEEGVLEFEHDSTRTHSPIIEKMKKIVVIESKSISEYLNQLEEIGENKMNISEFMDIRLEKLKQECLFMNIPMPAFR